MDPNRAVEREDLNRATEYLDTQQLPKQARKLAQELAAVLDAADLEELSRRPEGSTEGGLTAGRERIGAVKTGSGSHEIFLDRMQRGKEPPIWLFSADTLKWVPRVHGELNVGWIERHITGTFLETSNDAFLADQEELLMKIMDIVRANGAKFALPLPALSPVKDRIANA